jgi:5S rRNA maturation endonuclease (ribonuclease M5)
MEKGVWNCHAGCGSGGILAFEMKFSSCDESTAKGNISDLLHDDRLFQQGQKPEAIYKYQDADGRLVFEKLRMPGKRFVQRQPDGKGGYEYKLGDVKKPLYHLPEVLVANEIFICEGEKDCDNIRALGLSNREDGVFVAATTNFDGAGKWKDEYSAFFAGKRVVVLPDNDEPGEKHAQRVAESIYPYAQGVKVVRLPELAEKGDVSDYLVVHSAEDLIVEVKKAPQWRPAVNDSGLLVPITSFLGQAPEEIDWLIEGLVQRGANGFFCAVPKGGKSWAAADMVISLALGSPWLGFSVPRPARVALISREDAPQLTSWRVKHLIAGKRALEANLIETNLYVNTRQQSAELMLDNEEQVCELVSALKQRQIEFVILDVFNVMHAADENDNQEMRKVLRQLSMIQKDVGCGIGVVHHFNKADQGSMTQRLRGSSAIAGWAEWLIGISIVDEERRIRRMEFELKAAQPPTPITYQIVSNDTNGVATLERLEWERPIPVTNRSRAAELIRQ